MWHIFLLLTLFLCFLYLILDTKKPKRYPPGPDWLPVIGNYLTFYKLYKELGYTHLVWYRLSKIFGPLVGLKLGQDRLIIASGNKTIREILTREEFDARPDGFFFRLRAFGQRLGLVFVEGEFFNEQKKFVIKHLKSFGFNRNVMEDRITVETIDLVAAIKESKENIVRIPEGLSISVVNTLWSIVAGERFKLGDARPAELISLINSSFRLQDMSGGILNQMPYIRFLAPELSSYNKLKMILDKSPKFIQDLIEEHKRTVSSYNNRDLIDAYLAEIDKKKNHTFTEKQLTILLLDLFLAGSETTTSTLSFAILYLIHFPYIQKKLQKEIDAVLGGVPAKLQHRSSLKYLEAFMMEVQRHANVTPTTVSHRATKDTEILGYTIPKDTVILANLFTLHMDKEHWGDPKVFRPERFLNENEDIINEEWLLPFGIGKRKCPGETLSKTTMFLFLSSLIQNFNIQPLPGQPVPQLIGSDGATISPKSFRCIFSPRR